MSPRTGRPKVDNPKRNDLKVRFDDHTMQQLDRYCAENGLSRAEAIRQGVYLLLEQAKEK